MKQCQSVLYDPACTGGNTFDPPVYCTNSIDNQEICAGDSGSPNFIKNADASQDIQIGIASFGSVGLCGQRAFTGYERISAHYGWLSRTICTKSDASESQLQFDCECARNVNQGECDANNACQWIETQ